MKKWLLFLLLGALPCFAANNDFNGRWRLDPKQSTALDGWTAADLVISVEGSKVTMRYDMEWHATKSSATNVVDTAQPVKLAPFFRIDQRHMAVYSRPNVPADVVAGWLDDGRTLRVESLVPVEISQGNTTLRLYDEYRLLEGGNALVLIELHNTRQRPLVYRFTKVAPTEAARK